MRPVPSPMQLRWWVTFEDSLREDSRAEKPPLLTWGIKKEQGNHLTGPDQKPDQRRRTLSVHLPSTLSSKSFYQEEKHTGPMMEWRMTPADLNAWAFPLENHWVDLLACTAVGLTCLVARIPRRSWPRWHPGIHQEGVGVLRYQKWDAAPSKWRTTNLHCQHPIPWTGIESCHSMIWDLAARTINWCSLKRPWLTHRPSNIGQKKPSHWPEVSLTNWQKVWRSSDVIWNPWPHLPMCMFWMMPHSPTGWRLCPLGWQSLPQGSAAIAGPIGLMLEGCFW